jgi:hypothetical protein
MSDATLPNPLDQAAKPVNACPKCSQHSLVGVPKSLQALGCLMGVMGGSFLESIYLTVKGYQCPSCGPISMSEVPSNLRRNYHLKIGFSVFCIIVVFIALIVIINA